MQDVWKTEGFSQRVRIVQDMFQGVGPSGADPRSDKIELVEVYE